MGEDRKAAKPKRSGWLARWRSKRHERLLHESEKLHAGEEDRSAGERLVEDFPIPPEI